MRRKVIINWQVSSFFGWGVYGLNLALAWAADPDLELVAASGFDDKHMALDPIRLRRLGRFAQQSRQLSDQIQAFQNQAVAVKAPMLATVTADFGVLPVQKTIFASGAPTIAVTFFETAQHAPEAIERAAQYPLIVTGSTWNEQVLRAHGLTNVRTILQGIDPLLFHAAPRPPRGDGRFLVFSGGKLELRKGQDLAVAAFRKFAERHADAVLVAAWHSPWPQLARTVDQTGVAAPVAFAGDRLDAAAWAAANGIRPDQFIYAGETPNALMPSLLRQLDVALFPNRCEGGTNLVAMECMACGIPTILSGNTGHLDLIEEDNCYVLTQQAASPWTDSAAAFGDTPGWGESDVDEAVELLERAYRDRDEARRRGERGAATLAKLTWSRSAAAMKNAVLNVLGGQTG
ncbi:glycosyltransferase family 4 protein [Phenylobacterium sp. LjRoot219]|uniref:glycosyltransferase family 4 protein n=1 Tax=Phenylobacterium sp. LjRoot219 TaxID=3342283 RepID=UPI003ECFBFB9